MPPRPPARRFGAYELLAQLASGGMAEIFLARMGGSDGFTKLVVIKRLLEELAQNGDYVAMFLDEARINAPLSHSNVVQCLDLGEADGHYFMALEYVSGLSLAQVGRLATQRLGKVPQAVATGTVAQAAAGLHYVHERRLPDGTSMGIIHRDVSPQNLILTAEGMVKLVDFGIARARLRATQTRPGVLKGKIAYLSPEQVRGEPFDRRVDLFALGVVLFELCTARRLFRRREPQATYEAITSGEIPDPQAINPEVPKEVARVIRKALAHSPDERFQSADELQEELERAMQRSGIRGNTTALAQFLEEQFSGELAAQRALVAAAEEGALVDEPPPIDEPAQEPPLHAPLGGEGDSEELTSLYPGELEEEPAEEATSLDEDPGAERTTLDERPPIAPPRRRPPPALGPPKPREAPALFDDVAETIPWRPRDPASLFGAPVPRLKRSGPPPLPGMRAPAEASPPQGPPPRATAPSPPHATAPPRPTAASPRPPAPAIPPSVSPRPVAVSQRPPDPPAARPPVGSPPAPAAVVPRQPATVPLPVVAAAPRPGIGRPRASAEAATPPSVPSITGPVRKVTPRRLIALLAGLGFVVVVAGLLALLLDG